MTTKQIKIDGFLQINRSQMKLRLAYRRGAMRHVFLIGCYTIKIPRIHLLTLREDFAQGTILDGFYANADEIAKWRTSPSENLCPVLWGAYRGIILAMARAEPLSKEDESELDRLVLEEVSVSGFHGPRIFGRDRKLENYGWLHGRIVKVDYGEPPRRPVLRLKP